MYRILALLIGLLGAHATALAQDPCDGFSWDVKVERALFTQDGAAIVAGLGADHAPELELATGYSLALAPQGQVGFVAGPSRKSLPDGAHAGIARLHVAHAGVYRVSLDVSAWIDVVVAGQVVPSRAFQGRAGCNAPHKVVEYDLPAGDAWIQISGATQDHVRAAVTRSPMK
jgi:hypothetical protein